MCAYERQSALAAALLEKADAYLDLSVIEQKMLSVFNVAEYPVHNIMALAGFHNDIFSSIIEFYAEKSPLFGAEEESISVCVDRAKAQRCSRVSKLANNRNFDYSESTFVYYLLKEKCLEHPKTPCTTILLLV